MEGLYFTQQNKQKLRLLINIQNWIWWSKGMFSFYGRKKIQKKQLSSIGDVVLSFFRCPLSQVSFPAKYLH